MALEIVRGRTRYPHRPVGSDEFLIGSSESCDLRLSAAYPEFHSLIALTEDSARITVVADDPPLSVNGSLTTGCELRDGDLIEMSGISLRVSVERQARSHEAEITELVEALERDLEFVQQADHDRQAAEVRLRDWIQSQLQELQTSALQGTPPLAAPNVLDRRLERFLERVQLDSRSRNVAASHLADAQQRAAFLSEQQHAPIRRDAA